MAGNLTDSTIRAVAPDLSWIYLQHTDDIGHRFGNSPQMEKAITQIKKQMEKAARDLDFMEAAKLRDEMFRLQKELEGMKK